MTHIYIVTNNYFERILEKKKRLFIRAGRTFLVSHLEHEKLHHLEHGGNQFIT
jgi:hypothetical protein